MKNGAHRGLPRDAIACLSYSRGPARRSWPLRTDRSGGFLFFRLRRSPFGCAQRLPSPWAPGIAQVLPARRTASSPVEYAASIDPMLSLGRRVLYGFTPMPVDWGTTSQPAWPDRGRKVPRIPILGRAFGPGISARRGLRGGDSSNGDSFLPGSVESPLVEGDRLSYAVGPAAKVARLDRLRTRPVRPNGNPKSRSPVQCEAFPVSRAMAR